MASGWVAMNTLLYLFFIVVGYLSTSPVDPFKYLAGSSLWLIASSLVVVAAWLVVYLPVFALVPSSQSVRMWHLMGMWLMLLFVIVHVYMAIRAEMMSRSNSVGVILSGWRTWKDDGLMKPE